MRSDAPSPNFVFLGDLRLNAPWLAKHLDFVVQVAIEANATTAPKLARFMREREARA